jgi:hypothetical protein
LVICGCGVKGKKRTIVSLQKHVTPIQTPPHLPPDPRFPPVSQSYVVGKVVVERWLLVRRTQTFPCKNSHASPAPPRCLLSQLRQRRRRRRWSILELLLWRDSSQRQLPRAGWRPSRRNAITWLLAAAVVGWLRRGGPVGIMVRRRLWWRANGWEGRVLMLGTYNLTSAPYSIHPCAKKKKSRS